MEEAWDGELRLIMRRNPNGFDADVQVNKRLHDAIVRKRGDGLEIPPHHLFSVDYTTKRIGIFPLVTYFSEQLYQPKYEKIRAIWIDLAINDDDPKPENAGEAADFLAENMPYGFIKDIEYGLGVTKEMRPLIYAIERIEGISGIHITRSGPTCRSGHYFQIAEADFNSIRSMFGRITRIHQNESLRERHLVAHNEVLHRALPDDFPLKVRPYESGTIFKLIGGTNAASSVLKGKDRVALLEAVKGNAEAIANRDPQEFMQLQKDIELVSLDRLIDAFERRLNRNRKDAEWQRLFEINPFILSMLFGYPLVVMQPSAAVGGGTITGSGTKVADFLSKNSSTHNAALVEIKRPDTPLFGAEYRAGVWAPSPALMGAVVQVLDQRQKFATNIANIKHTSRLPELEAYAIDCVLVAGRTPQTPDKASSFELMRSQFKDVRIVTFDDLLGKLILLREMLTGERYVSSVLPGDYEDESEELIEEGDHGDDHDEEPA
ncbi:DUF4263 domain-containing protein [Neorhizobium galegae]|nr:DUF4263 domain-containing protein [Neorhizobium galegae]